MKVLLGLPIALLLAACCAAQQSASTDLQRKADQASGAECVRYSMQVARKSLEDAAKLFDGGEVQAAHSAIDVSVNYVRRSVDCSVEARKGEKAAEIELRGLVRRMDDIRRTVDTEDRPHLAQSISELEKQRDRLLKALFGPIASGAAEEKP